MDWDTPSRTRLLFVAALFLGAWGLYAGGAGERPIWWTLGVPEQHDVRTLSAPEPGTWRDAPASPPAAAASSFSPAAVQRAAAGLSASHFTLSAGQSVAWHEPRPAAAFLPGPRPRAETAESSAETGSPLPSSRSASAERARPTAQEVSAQAQAAAQPGEPAGGPIGPPGRRAAFRPGRRVVREEIVLSGPEPSPRARARRPRSQLARDPRLPSPAARRALRLRFKPLLLSRLLGRASIRPPRGSISVPDLSGLDALKPRSMPDGRPVPPPAADSEVEALTTEPPACPEKNERNGHWHLSAGGVAPALWHAGKAFGQESGGGWVWRARSGGRAWAYTAKTAPTWLRYRERWWWKSEGLWFMLHDGEAWGYKLLTGTDQEGFGHPVTGAELVYSADGRVAALVIPGQGAVVYDAYTGEVLARLGPDSLPRRAQARAPAALSAPR